MPYHHLESGMEGCYELGLWEIRSTHWNNYIRAPKASHIQIVDREDELIWKHVSHGVYTQKVGYI